MSERPPGIRRLCVAMEIDGDAGEIPGVVRPRRWRRDLGAVIEELGRVDALDRAHWNPPAVGGGEIAFLPPGIDEGCFVAEFVTTLRSALVRLNGGVPRTERVRLRVALHQGITFLDGSGFIGRAVVKVAALRDCAALRAELRCHPSVDLALAVSGDLFDDVVEHDYPGLRGRDFRSEQVRLGSGPDADAWLLTPVLTGATARPAAATAPRDPAAAAASRGQTVARRPEQPRRTAGPPLSAVIAAPAEAWPVRAR
ncbi:hypothetical protein [Frankia sp. AvcI1]|uniref:hypothetical protein n=1 Tax=Frankia sp. AvcI1 TaxID=573496 RepID=UPI002117887B|nr:hypothetical protein [Frankia sp. AvcI1]